MRQSQLRFDLKAWWRVPNMARKLSATVPPFVAPTESNFEEEPQSENHTV